VATDSGSIQFDFNGLKETRKALRGCDVAVTRELRSRLKPIGEMVAVEMRSRIHSVSGDLKKSVKVRVAPKKFTVRVISDARHPWNPRTMGSRSKQGGANMRTGDSVLRLKGRRGRFENPYRYGKRIEFDPAYNGRHAWFYPAWEAKKAAAFEQFKTVTDVIVKEFNT